MKTRVAVYYRVSTAAQGDPDRMGLPAQWEATGKYCAAQDYEVVGTYEDRTSGMRKDRPALQQMLEDAKEGLFTVVVVPRWDRLARKATLDGALRWEFEEHGVIFESATEPNGVDPISKLTQSVLRDFAEYQRQEIVWRLNNSRRLKKEMGGFAGGQTPLGWYAPGNGKLEIDPEGQKKLARLRELHASGLGWSEIARKLNEEGITSRRGGIWRPGTVQSALNSHFPDKDTAREA
ncbi:MAG: recombinase family protein [Patescibacteria group bacterium]|nr:recombinase family protein [Patescibacteria group bacterium]